MVHNPSVQARQICGNVHIHQPFVPPPSPLPPPGLLLGRDADLQAMAAARGSRLIVSCLCRSGGRTPMGHSHPRPRWLLRRRRARALRAEHGPEVRLRRGR